MTSSGGQQVTYSQCGREPCSGLAGARPQPRPCVLRRIGLQSARGGFAIRGMSPLRGTHLVEWRSQGFEVQFVDGGICTVRVGHEQVGSEHNPGGDWERCPLCQGFGCLAEEKLNEERGRAEDEQRLNEQRRAEAAW